MDRARQATNELNGDLRLSFGERVRYLCSNARRNMVAIGTGPATRAFVPPRSASGKRFVGQSPSRFLTEVFIDSELPQLLTQKQVEVVEIGCGSGSMSARLATLGFGGRYTGIDIVDQFRPQALPSSFTSNFIESDAHRFIPERPIDLLISVSALEHIPDDAKLIKRLATHMAPGGLELHVVPGAASLFTYLWHGYRQYTPKGLADRFGEGRTSIVRLGGLGTFLLHLCFITSEVLVGRSLRTFAPRLYGRMLRGALMLDRFAPVCATAYAVIRRH